MRFRLGFRLGERGKGEWSGAKASRVRESRVRVSEARASEARTRGEEQKKGDQHASKDSLFIIIQTFTIFFQER